MFSLRQMTWLAAFACLFAGGVAIRAGHAQDAYVVPVKLGISSMSATEQAKLWKLVDEYATVDALQEFCGIKLNLQGRALRAVSACVEPTSLRRVFGKFRTKKADYLKQWETLHGQPDAKKAVCDRFKTKLGEYAKIMSGQLNDAATACRNCFFC
jgi:hypothetical protein